MELIVCVEGGGGRGPIYSSRGRFPANAHMEGDQVPWQPLLLEVHLDRNQASADPTWQPLSLIFCWMVYSLILILWCILCGGPVSSDMWALFVRVWRRMRSSASCVASAACFVLFRSCSSKMYKTHKQLWSKVIDTNM